MLCKMDESNCSNFENLYHAIANDSRLEKDLLHHIAKDKIKNKKELDIEFILKEIAPAQTSTSLIAYLDNLKRERINGVLKQSKLPLCELTSKRLIEKSPINPIFNEDHNGEQKRQEWGKIIFAYYKKLI